jgi:hypothetical protein
MKRLVLAAGLCLMFLSGCGEGPIRVVTEEEQVRRQYVDWGGKVKLDDTPVLLPEGAKNIRDMGNGWLLFDLKVPGYGERTFLLTRHYVHGTKLPTITQVK